MADRNLIQGAALVGRSKMPGNIQNVTDQLIRQDEVAARKAEAKKNSINSKTASYINSLNSNVDLAGLTPEQQKSITSFLVDKRNAYASAASEIARIEDPSDPRYLELRDQMNGVQMAFGNLSKQLNAYKEDKVNYLKDFNDGVLSDGNDIGSLSKAANIYTDQGNIAIDDSGSLNFWDEDKGNYDSYSQIQKPFLKDFKTADTILSLNEKIYNAGAPLTGARANMIREKLKNAITKGGRQTLMSLATDDFIVEGGLGLKDPKLFDPANQDLLKQKVLDGYMQAFTEAANQGAEDKKPKRAGNGFTRSLQQDIQLSQEVASQGLNFSQIANFKGGNTEQKASAIVQELNSVDPTKPGNYITRGEYYEGWLENNEIEDSEQARNQFIKKHPRTQQIFLYDSRKQGPPQPISASINNPKDLYQLYLRNSNISDKAQNYHLLNYDNYVPSNKEAGKGVGSKYNK